MYLDIVPKSLPLLSASDRHPPCLYVTNYKHYIRTTPSVLDHPQIPRPILLYCPYRNKEDWHKGDCG